jgi:hypothetical protein
MRESPRQLLEGIALALAQDVSPHIEDRFAQMQCKAAAELLGNLAAELEWAAGPLHERNAELREILAALEHSGWPAWSARPSPAAEASAAQARAVLLDELRDAMRWLAGQDPAAAAEVDALLSADLARQVASLRGGMFR